MRRTCGGNLVACYGLGADIDFLFDTLWWSVGVITGSFGYLIALQQIFCMNIIKTNNSDNLLTTPNQAIYKAQQKRASHFISVAVRTLHPEAARKIPHLSSQCLAVRRQNKHHM